MHWILNRYTGFVIAGQLVAAVLIWLVVLATSPSGDRIFALLFYFYFPAIALVSMALGKGESGMIAAVVYGMAFGILVYGCIAGIVVTALKRR